MSEQKPAEAAPRTQRSGTCHACGSGSCRHYMSAVTVDLTGAKHEDGKPYVGGQHIDHEALIAAHGIKPGDGPALTRQHEDPTKPDVNLTGMDPKPTASFQKNGGRVGPVRVKIIPRGARR